MIEPEETNPEELLKRIIQIERDLKDMEAGITRMAEYLGVLHVLKGA